MTSIGPFNIPAFERANINAANKPIAVDTLERLNVRLEAVKLPDELRARLAEAKEPPAPPPGVKPDNHPDNIYATVKVNGEIVATLYKSGGAATSNATYAKVRNLPSMGEGETLTGPELAQKRAEDIARAMGGKIEKAAAPAAPKSQSAWTGVSTAQFLSGTDAAALAASRMRFTAVMLAQDAYMR